MVQLGKTKGSTIVVNKTMYTSMEVNILTPVSTHILSKSRESPKAPADYEKAYTDNGMLLRLKRKRDALNSPANDSLGVIMVPDS